MKLYRYEMTDHYGFKKGFITGVFHELYFESKAVEKLFKKITKMIPIPPTEIFHGETKSYFKKYGYNKTFKLVSRLIRIIPYTKYHNTSKIRCIELELSEDRHCDILYDDDEFQIILREPKKETMCLPPKIKKKEVII